MLAFPHIDPGEFVEVRDFARNLDGQRRRIKTRNAFHAGFACQNGATESLFAYSVGADNTHSTNHYPGKHQVSVSDELEVLGAKSEVLFVKFDACGSVRSPAPFLR
jgi:hypothetical protein